MAKIISPHTDVFGNISKTHNKKSMLKIEKKNVNKHIKADQKTLKSCKRRLIILHCTAQTNEIYPQI